MASQVRSVYLALHYFGRTCRGGLLYEVKIGKNGKIFRKSTEDKPDCSAMKLFDENDIPEVPFVRCVSHASKLYLFVGQQYKEYEAGAKVAYILDPKTIFDANTKSLNSFDPPKACRTSPKFMSAHGMLYHLATPLIAEPEAPMPFEIYDPTTKSWDSLTPLPRCPVKIPNVHARRELIGYAVFDNCILLMLWYPGLKFVPVVFNAEWRTWHQVNLEGVGLDLLPFRGKAVVVGDTIYALSFKHGKVISFSIKISGLEEDGTSIYSLTTPYQLEGLKKNFTPKFKFLVMQTEYMAPFGDLEFCLVRSMRHNINTFQPLWITTFKIIEEEGKKSRIETLDRTVQFVSTEGYGHFWIKFCFTPDYEPKEAMLNTKKEDIQKERNRIKGSSREVDCFIPDMKPKEASLTNRKFFLSQNWVSREDGQKETSWIKNSYCKVECSTPALYLGHFEPNEESFTNEKVGIQKEMNSVKPSPCKVECVTSDFELGEESVTKKKRDNQQETIETKRCPGKVNCIARDFESKESMINKKKVKRSKKKVKLTEEKVKRTEKKATKRDSHILSLVKRHVSTVKSYGRTDIPVACIILFICLFGFFRLENGEAPLLLGKRIGIGIGMGMRKQAC